MVLQQANEIVGKSWISKEDKELIDKLRECVLDVLPPDELSKSEDDLDAFLFRWLVARDKSVDKAESMLKSALQWRKENNLDKALENEVDPYLKENYRWTFVGTDLEGRPVGICPFYDWDFRKMLAANKSDQFDNFMQYFFESVVKDIRTYNENRIPGQAPFTHFTPIMDVSGYAYGQMLSITAMRKWFQLASTYEAYYPEVLYRAIFINCPGYFKIFLNMLKGFLAPRTMAKITCYSSVADWQKDIQNMMDPAIVPVQYGGTCKVNPLERSFTN